MDKYVVLEDKIKYAIMDTIELDNTKYLFLCKIEELDKDNPLVVIRKLDEKEKNILGLDSEEEYKKALSKYLEKNTNN